MKGFGQFVTVLGAIMLTTIAVCLLAGWWETIREDRRRTNVPDDSSDPFADVMPDVDPTGAGWLSDPDEEIAAFYRREQHTQGGDV